MTDDKQAELDAAALAAKVAREREWGRMAVARPDPLLFLLAVPTEIRRNALVDAMLRKENPS